MAEKTAGTIQPAVRRMEDADSHGGVPRLGRRGTMWKLVWE